MVVAGAGSGKTRVLAHRIAHLIEHHQYQPHEIMAVTFTNKAAKHIAEQLNNLIGPISRSIWMGTFHHLCHRMIRKHAHTIGLSPNFTIIDQEDQRRLIKQLIKDAGIDEDKHPVKKIQHFINNMKEKGKRAHDINTQGSTPYEKTMTELMTRYEKACKANHIVDFSELLCLGLDLFAQPEALTHYQAAFRYLLVDEFQDSNTIQYQWLKTLSANKIPTMVVGDDDQSIYGWRGAQVENMLGFSKDFTPCETFRLEQNYRSSATILNAANALIAKNKNRLGKSLWTEAEAGSLIEIKAAHNETEEAQTIVAAIEAAAETHPYHDMAILYRSNAQSRVLEEQITKAGLPYQIYGGLRFFERAEIKDTLAYLRLILQPEDTTAFWRIINRPTRGIGQTTLDAVHAYSIEQHCAPFTAAETLSQDPEGPLSKRAQKALSDFFGAYTPWKDSINNLPPHIFMEQLIERSGLLELYQRDKSKQGRSKVENLEELINASRCPPEDNMTYQTFWIEFLAKTALNQGVRESGEEDGIQLMTLHSAKGLEFPYVFLCGMEEGLFPHQMTYHDPESLAEERRLCYVGMTRAMKKLTFTYSQSRNIHGQRMYRSPSRYLQDIPEMYIKSSASAWEAQNRQTGSETSSHHTTRQDMPSQKTTSVCGFALGQTVFHEHFGEGTVLNVDPSQKHIQVRFEQHGAKWLVLAYANLSPR